MINREFFRRMAFGRRYGAHLTQLLLRFDVKRKDVRFLTLSSDGELEFTSGFECRLECSDGIDIDPSRVLFEDRDRKLYSAFEQQLAIWIRESNFSRETTLFFIRKKEPRGQRELNAMRKGGNAKAWKCVRDVEKPVLRDRVAADSKDYYFHWRESVGVSGSAVQPRRR